jgi:DNA replication protein DnaC
MWTWWVKRSSSAPVNRSDPAVTVAAIDRLVHHATILELNTESYRRRVAGKRAAAE